jgi:hypothetical protein
VKGKERKERKRTGMNWNLLSTVLFELVIVVPVLSAGIVIYLFKKIGE